jgi:hypothetical protein
VEAVPERSSCNHASACGRAGRRYNSPADPR